MKEKLLKYLPKKYHERVNAFYTEMDLIDDCKYMLELNDNWVFCDNNSIPCKTIKEAVSFVKESYYSEN